MRPALALATLLALAAGPASAQFAQSAVESCLRIPFDASVAPEIVGTWYLEILSPAGDMVNRQYQQFDANGLWQYQDQTCATQMQLPCSQNQGHGLYVVNAQGGGSYYIARIFNDLERTNWCQGAQVRVLDRNTLQLPDGSVMQRVN